MENINIINTNITSNLLNIKENRRHLLISKKKIISLNALLKSIINFKKNNNLYKSLSKLIEIKSDYKWDLIKEIKNEINYHTDIISSNEENIILLKKENCKLKEQKINLIYLNNKFNNISIINDYYSCNKKFDFPNIKIINLYENICILNYKIIKIKNKKVLLTINKIKNNKIVDDQLPTICFIDNFDKIIYFYKYQCDFPQNLKEKINNEFKKYLYKSKINISEYKFIDVQYAPPFIQKMSFFK